MANARSLLLVEDDETTRELLTVLFVAEGWRVESVPDGEAALHALPGLTALPPVILCDMHLPGLCGPGLAARLREIAPQSRLLAMSASHFAKTPAGYDAALRKPFGPKEVGAALDGLVPVVGSGPANMRETGPAVLHAETVASLRKTMGGRAKDLYTFAFADAGDRIMRMRQAAEGGDPAAYRSQAHALKGSAGMIGAEQLAALAAEAEISTINNSSIPADTELERLQLAWEALHLALEAAFPV